MAMEAKQEDVSFLSRHCSTNQLVCLFASKINMLQYFLTENENSWIIFLVTYSIFDLQSCPAIVRQWNSSSCNMKLRVGLCSILIGIQGNYLEKYSWVKFDKANLPYTDSCSSNSSLRSALKSIAQMMYGRNRRSLK